MRIKDIPEIVGKTIKSVELNYDSYISRGLQLSFDDGTTLSIEILHLVQPKIEISLRDDSSDETLMERKDYRGPYVKLDIY